MEVVGAGYRQLRDEEKTGVCWGGEGGKKGQQVEKRPEEKTDWISKARG